MIKIDNFEVVGWEHAIRGMRNPMNSWSRSDSFVCKEGDPVEMCNSCPDNGHCKVIDDEDHYIIGNNDQQLMMKLAKGGPVHAKYRRMITVYVDILAPLYWWKEFDTYKVGTVANSCSTMHKIHAKEFTLDDFSHDHLTFYENNEPYANWYCGVDHDICYSAGGILEHVIIPMLNTQRKLYIDTKNKKYWWNIIQLLPSSYNQKRTVMLNYEVLHNIYISRKNHKLDCWLEFCDWIKKLPYSEIITMEEPENEVSEM